MHGRRGEGARLTPSPTPTPQGSYSSSVSCWTGLERGAGSGPEGPCLQITDKLSVSPQMQEKAKEIYMTFLSSKASSQVNVEGQSRLNEKILEEPHPLMFQKLQDQVI